ncbi:MAG: hypothetical protein ACRDOO_21855, partial [Actinomadura sp.]
PPANTPNPVFEAYDKWKATSAQQGTGSDGSEAAPKRSTRDIAPLIGGFGVLVVIIIAVLLIMRARSRKRRKAAGMGPHSQPGVPPQGFGGPYPPQGGQYPPQGGQPPYYPPAGPGPQGGQPPQQGQYPPPGQPGQWNAPDQRS